MGLFESARTLHRRSVSTGAAPAWAEQPDGAYELRLRAVRMSMAALVGTIVALVAVGGAVATMLLIETDPGTRSMTVLVGGGIGLVLAIALLLTFQLRRRRCEVRIDPDGITAAGRRIPFDELRALRIRRSSDYARIEVVGRGRRVTLMAALGLAAHPLDVEAEYVPELPAGARALLERVGCEARRRGAVTEWSPRTVR